MVGVKGFEPSTPKSRTLREFELLSAPVFRVMSVTTVGRYRSSPPNCPIQASAHRPARAEALESIMAAPSKTPEPRLHRGTFPCCSASYSRNGARNVAGY
jgi:hypothetical protein